MTVRWVDARGWPSGIRIGFTERSIGGVGDHTLGFNLATHVGDNARRVEENRSVLQRSMPDATQLVWMNQVHGKGVSYADPQRPEPAVADALWTDQPGIGCCVLTADCLPVLLCDRRGERVAAVHAGWRGLAAGVLEAALKAAFEPGQEVMAWLGPAIGPDAFEVGSEVREAFSQTLDGEAPETRDRLFRASPHRPGHFLADLRGLAVAHLKASGVQHISGENTCTFSNPERFYSYRRDGQTGRMASFIVRLAPA